jgi:adenine deaminase
VNDNLVAVAEAGSLGEADLVQVERNAFEISWLGTGPKEELLSELKAYAASEASPPNR